MLWNPSGVGRGIGVFGTPLASRGFARAVYGLGSFGGSLVLQTTLLWLFYYYAPPSDANLPLRVSPSLVGIAMAVGRLMDALADLPVAYWSDRTRTRLGRRKPFIAVGAPLLILCFILLWTPPTDQPSWVNFLYLTVILALFFFLFTLVMNPYSALLPEITEGGEGRVVTAAWQAAFNLGGVGGAFVASSWLSSRYGFPKMAILLGSVALLAIWTVAGSTKEGRAEGEGWGIRQAVFEVLRMRKFMIYLTGLALMWFGLSMVNLSLIYFITVLMGFPKERVSFVLALSLLFTLAGILPVQALTKAVGKRRALIASLGMAALILPPLAAVGRWPLPLSLSSQGYLLIAAAGIPLAALFVLPNALLADIAEEHGRVTGVRHEALFFAFQGLVLNGTTSLSAAALGAILQALGYEAVNPLGLRVVPVLATVFVVAGLLAFLRYPEG